MDSPYRPKSERALRNLHNQPDTPELFTPQAKRPREHFAQSERARNMLIEQQEADETSRTEPPVQPQEEFFKRKLTPGGGRPPKNQRYLAKQMNGPPVWKREIRFMHTDAPPDTPQSYSGWETASNQGTPSSMTTRGSVTNSPYTVEGDAKRTDRPLSRSSSSRSKDSASAALSSERSASAAQSGSSSGSAAQPRDFKASPARPRMLSGSAASPSRGSGSAASPSQSSASAASSGDRGISEAEWREFIAMKVRPRILEELSALPRGNRAVAAPIQYSEEQERSNRALVAAFMGSSYARGIFTPPRVTRPRSSTPEVVDLVTPVPRSSRKKLRKSSTETLNLLHALGPTHKVMSLATNTDKVIIDSGASTSGTGLKSKLKNLRPAKCTVSAAFGETITPTEMGDLPPHMLPTVVIEGMKDTTLLSVSQACAEGMCGIFTSRDCRFYALSDAQPHLAKLSRSCQMKLRGEVEDGLYIQKSI